MRKKKVDKILSQNSHLNFVKRLYEPNTPSITLPGEDSPSTHFMESADARVYPTIVQKPDLSLEYLADRAYDHAMNSGEYIQFKRNRQARRFAESYKRGTGVLNNYN